MRIQSIRNFKIVVSMMTSVATLIAIGTIAAHLAWAQAPTPTDINLQRQLDKLEGIVTVLTERVNTTAEETARVRQNGFERIARLEGEVAENRTILGALMALILGDLVATVSLFRKVRNGNNRVTP